MTVAPKRSEPASEEDSIHYTANNATQQKQPSRRKWFIVAAVVLLVVLVLSLTLGLYYGLKKDSKGDNDNDNEEPTDRKDGPFVNLGYAEYEGNVLDNDIHEYLGIRYAKAPSGDLRWRAPVKPDSTTKPQKAQEFATYCPGVDDGINSRINEDCLFANIWAPANASKLPVMVFFQSGGYIRNASPYVNGTQLINTSENNLIFVNFNYRVGMFGFLAGKEVKEDGDLNAGLLDQRFLLQWVQEHIHSFGGDPEHVIIHGESAGAGSVALQLVAYGGKDEGLFAGAIAESTFMPGLPEPDDLQYQFDRLVNETGCSDADGSMGCLREMESAKLQTHNSKAPFDGRTYRSYFYWAPTTDGDMFPDYPSKLYENGDFVKVPLLSGSCTNEGSNYAVNAGSSAQFIRYMQNEYPYLTTNDTETILDLYPQEPKIAKHDTWFPSASRAYGEATFICPTNNILNAFAQHADPETLWSYRYNVQITDFVDNGLGVPHVSNAPAVFGPDMTAARAGPTYRTYNAPMVPIVQKYWISFVRSFDPNTHRDKDAPEWDNWGDGQNRLVFELNNNTMETVDEGQRERCQAWLDLSDSTRQ
ncbi:lipase 2 [Fusarium heterosporum]|uniref:Carboxylic ester hydrolase n=1 Tax=Fusarium heterosporum TaxID=42747 RepID=A0A8H5WK93_FUSHE|nr:lipase 2 [Fusarium heterosporum]